MIILLLIFAFVLLLAFCWLGSFFIFCGAKAFKSPETARPAAKALSWLSALAVLTAALLWYLFFPPATVVYGREFNESPSSDVRNLYSVSEGGYDSQVVKLRFEAAPATIARLAKIQKLPLIPRNKMAGENFAESNAPEWWNPQVTAQSQVYGIERSKQTGGFFHESVWLRYDPQTRTAYYSFFGVD
ncbi:hypothetical protein B1R32_11253 [Abditibacterium utsteinense]|uniref:Uncharacterized protein n=1 Tax=Abditibacterium utsteinense TaxID=1960156 RepID=A0A2S8SRJ3_9BACT|nr:hypothetical protein [Abditibacterium utsteinense]PQV63398.1 hypothetical protein B1R32_11253 [Abditibacterium utsteinense]